MTNFTRDELNRLYRYAVSLCDNEADAFDLVQASVEKILTKAEPLTNPMAFARQVIKHLFIDQYRRSVKHIHYSLSEYEVDDQPVPLVETGFSEVMLVEDEFKRCWQLMNTAERELLFLHAVEGYTAQEIAEETKTARGTVLSRIHRIKLRVRQLLNNNPAPRGEIKT